MEGMISRSDALALLDKASMDEALYNHCLETEAVMRGLANKLEQDQEVWGLTGLLHDLDFPETKDNPADHGLLSDQKLQGKMPEESLQAIRAHNQEMNKTQPQSLLDYALRCGETVTGLISANALVRPQGMKGMKSKSLKKKMKDKSFAANVNRDRIKECEKIGLSLDDFFQIAINSIEDIETQVGLG